MEQNSKDLSTAWLKPQGRKKSKTLKCVIKTLKGNLSQKSHLAVFYIFVYFLSVELNYFFGDKQII